MLEQLKSIIEFTLRHEFQSVSVGRAYEVRKINNYKGYYFELYRYGISLLQAYVENNIIEIQFVDTELYTEEIEAIKSVTEELGYYIYSEEYKQFGENVVFYL